jgi:hypothetical protein
MSSQPEIDFEAELAELVCVRALISAGVLYCTDVWLFLVLCDLLIRPGTCALTTRPAVYPTPTQEELQQEEDSASQIEVRSIAASVCPPTSPQSLQRPN